MRLILAGVLVSMIVGAYFRGAADKEAELTAQYQQAYIDQFTHYQNKEREAADRFAEIDKTYTQELFDAQEVIDGVISDVRTGKRRLFVKTSNAKCIMPKTGPAASVGDATGKARLDQDVAERLIRLTERGDKAIIQLGACQEYAREAQELCK